MWNSEWGMRNTDFFERIYRIDGILFTDEEPFRPKADLSR